MLNPVVIFCYRRSIVGLIESLKKNPEYARTKFYIFSDGWKSEKDRIDVENVRKELNLLKFSGEFEVKESRLNRGLAKSVIEGVTYVISKHGSVIVLEDDLIVSPIFLGYMNSAIEKYKDNRNIWSISGYVPPIFEDNEDSKFDVFLYPRASSWGWSTWYDRWKLVNWSVPEFESFRKNEKQKNDFQKGGNDLYKMLELQMLGKIDSWAIRWNFYQFLSGMATLYPRRALVINNGFNDGLGTHTTGNYIKSNTSNLNGFSLDVNKLACTKSIDKKMLDYHRIGLITKIGYFSKKYGGYVFLKKIQTYFLKIRYKKSK